ncbi:MAG: PepSY domain-containing protein [Thermoleophilaceae bacterium]|nr:PepSY domain-containing protein [Thermoleophilaceae bacterium]
MSKRIKKTLMGIAALAALALGGAALAQGGGASGESDETVTGRGADRAKAAALGITRGGTANSVELDDENGATWEVEVTKPGGKTVDVRLDGDYKLVVVEGDTEDEGDTENESR